MTLSTAKLYATSVAWGEGTNGIFTVDPENGDVALFADFDLLGITVNDANHRLAFRPSDGTLWLTQGGTGDPVGPNLYVFNSDTGALLQTYTAPPPGGGTEWWKTLEPTLTGGAWVADKFYCFDRYGSGRLLRFDPATAAWTTILDELNFASFGDWDRWPGDDLIAINGRLYSMTNVKAGLNETRIWSCLPDGTDQRTEYSHSGNLHIYSLSHDGEYVYGANYIDTMYRWPIGLDGALGTRESVWTDTLSNRVHQSVVLDGDIYCTVWASIHKRALNDPGTFTVTHTSGEEVDFWAITLSIPCAGFDFSSPPEIVYAFDPGGPNEDEPEQPQPYGDAILVPMYEGYIHLIEDGVLSTFAEPGWGFPGGIHQDGTFLQNRAKFSADGSTVDATFLQQTGPGWSNSAANGEDFAIDDNGRIWGGDNQRAIWCWNSDGTIYREFNDSAAPSNAIPDGPRAFAWHDGKLYLASADGVWVTDPYDPSYVVDQWPERSPANYPGSYELHFDRLVLIDYWSGDASTYRGGIAVHQGRVYFTDTGQRSGDSVPSRILSCAITGIDQTPTVEYQANNADGTLSPFNNGNFSITGLQVINEELYVAGWAVSLLYKFPACDPGCWNWVDLGELPDGGGEFGVVTSYGWIAERIISSSGYTTVAPGWDPNTIILGHGNYGAPIEVFDSNGVLQETFGEFDDPETVIFNSYDGNVYIQGNSPAYIDRYNPTTGTITNVVASNSSTTLYSGSARPSDGHLWGSLWMNRVWEYDLTGSLIGTYFYPQGELGYFPEFVQTTWADDGNLYLADYWGGVIRYEPDTDTWSYPIVHASDLIPSESNPRVMAITFLNERLYFVASENVAPTVMSCLLDGSDARIEVVIPDDPEDGIPGVFGITSVEGMLFLTAWTGGLDTSGGVWRLTPSRKVFYSSGGDSYIYSASYPDLTSLNTKSDGGWLYTYLLPYIPEDNITRTVYGMTLAPDGMLYVLVYRADSPSTDSGAEIWEFNTADPNDPGTVVFYDPNDGGSATGEMRAHIAYNPTDDRIYIGEGYGYFDGSQFFTSLTSVDRATWTRTNHLVFNNGFPASDPPFVNQQSIAVSPNGLVWFMTYDNSVSPNVRTLHVYDPSTDSTAQVDVTDPLSYGIDPFTLPDNTVLLLTAADNFTRVNRYTYTGGSIIETEYPIAALDASTGHPSWEGAFGNGGPGEAWVFTWDDHLWTYNTDCEAGCIGCWYVGMIGIIAL